jgi:hypothetical protein
MKITHHHHNDGDSGLNNRANFYADIKAVVQRTDQHEHPGTSRYNRAWGM